MATTTNYGFTVPTSADLVKNGATAISTLGQNIDTFLLRPFAAQPVINSAMQVWQRGTSIGSITSTATYTADRWCAISGASTTVTVSRQTTSDTTNLPNIQYALRQQRNSGQTGTSQVQLSQSMETINSIPFAGKTVTMSFYARAGANFSSTSSNLSAYLTTGTGTDQNAFSTYTGASYTITSNVTLTTTWQRFSVTGTVGSTVTELAPTFLYTPVGTAGTNDYYEVTGVQVEVGSQATPFRTQGITYQQELALCQRYYFRNVNGASTGVFAGGGVAFSTTAGIVPVVMPVPMRITPTTLDTTGTAANYRLYNGSINSALNAVPTIGAGDSTQNLVMLNVAVAAGLLAGSNFQLSANTSTGAYLGFGAEL